MMSKGSARGMPEKKIYEWNQQYLIRDGQPWLPMMGEFHYARYPQEEWRGELLKMKACGVDIAATYVFWIHHEPMEDSFDFSGRRCLRAFLETCRDVGMPVWLRIGPWCHGECRHGGFPEWLMQKDFPIRCNEKRYLLLVSRFWRAVFEQAKGLFHQDGGPVIGIQIENEFGHCGGEGGNEHMDKLLHMAREIGFIAPYYTATGWGGAWIGSMLPVMACYCDAPWDPRLQPLPPNNNYVFSHERNDVDVGSDFERGANVTFDEDAYPYLLAEMGGGIGSTFHRRPKAVPADTGAMSLVKLGSGANMLGYYMYHGGVNPGAEMNETRESGSYCETPVMSYAPHSPIGDGGQVTDLARELKLLSMFLHSYGSYLAPMPSVLPMDGAARPEDVISPRYALRMHNGSGFAFVNNYQRSLALPARCVNIPELGNVEIASGGYGILPVRLPVGHALVSSTKASPLCILNGNVHVFFGEHEYDIEGELGDCRLLTLSRQEALDAWLVKHNGEETLLLCESPVICDIDQTYCLTRKTVPWRTLNGENGLFAVPQVNSAVRFLRTNVNYLCYEYELDLNCAAEAHEVYLRVDYEGALAELFINGEKAADDLYDGSVWEVALNRYGRPEKAILRIYALFEGMPCWLQHPPVWQDGRALRLKGIAVENEYCVPWMQRSR